MVEVRITDQSIDEALLDSESPDATTGATVVFVGRARNSSSENPGSRVVRLEYEAYAPMALKELRAIAQECSARFGAHRVCVCHRTGVLPIGESAVRIEVTTPHRAEAFEGCRFVIEEIKKRVPIWKREVYDNGSSWVHAHP